MNVLFAIAIDDEPAALNVLLNHAAAVPFLQLNACFVSVTEALHYLQRHPVDLVFLDIQMPDKSGLLLAEEIIPKCQVIFTTAHAGHAVKGFDLAATDYLLKPISPARFAESCKRAFNQRSVRHQHATKAPEHIFVKSGYDLVRIELAELVYIQAADNYIVLQETGKHTVARITLSEIMTRLPANAFLRIHKSYIVAAGRVDRLENNKVVMGRHELPLSKWYKKNVFQLIDGKR